MRDELAALDPTPDGLLRDLADRGDLPDSVQRVDGSGIHPICAHDAFLCLAVPICELSSPLGGAALHRESTIPRPTRVVAAATPVRPAAQGDVRLLTQPSQRPLFGALS